MAIIGGTSLTGDGGLGESGGVVLPPEGKGVAPASAVSDALGVLVGIGGIRLGEADELPVDSAGLVDSSASVSAKNLGGDPVSGERRLVKISSIHLVRADAGPSVPSYFKNTLDQSKSVLINLRGISKYQMQTDVCGATS